MYADMLNVMMLYVATRILNEFVIRTFVILLRFVCQKPHEINNNKKLKFYGVAIHPDMVE